MKILMVAFGSAGDVLPLIHLSKVLQRQGLKVVFLTNDAFKETVQREGLEIHALNDAAEYVAFETDALLYEGPGAIFKFLQMCGAVSSLMWPRVIDLVRGVDLVMGSRFAFAAHLACTMHKVPFSAIALAPAHTSEGIDQQSPLVKRLLNQAMMKRLSGPPAELMTHLSAQQDLMGYFSNQRNLALFPPWFHKVPPTLSQWHQTGFCHLQVSKATRELNYEFDVAIAFGSTLMDVSKELRLLENVIASKGLRAVAISRGASSRNLAPNVEGFSILPWADYDELFSKSRIIVHHGGIGTLLQALVAGRPQIVLPRHVFDRTVNAQCVSKLEVGKVIEHAALDEKNLALALDAVLENDRHHLNAQQWRQKLLEETQAWEQETVQWIQSL